MHLRNPRMVGFGISNKQTFDAACANSSAIISRFVTLLNEAEGGCGKGDHTVERRAEEVIREE